MASLVRAALLGFVLSLAPGTVTRATDETAPSATPAKYKVGDTVYVCGCGGGKGCGCTTLQAGPGKCHCGSDLVPGKVTKVTEGALTVKTAAGERVVALK